MKQLSKSSLRNRLTRMVMLTCAVALLSACAVFTAYGYFAARQEMIDGESAVARGIALNSSAALTFQDDTAGKELLAGAAADERIVDAALYDRHGRIFASYSRRASERDLIPASPPKANRWTWHRMTVVQPIFNEEGTLGTLVLVCDSSELITRLMHFGGTAAIVFAISSLIAYLLASWLQQSISEPILELARTAFAVTLEKDYWIRAKKKKITDDEIGFLYDQFNEMLERIQERDSRLQVAQQSLEQRVRDRTADLEKKIAELEAAEDAVRHGNDRLQAVLESVGDVVLELDADAMILNMWNQKAEALVRPRSEMIGKKLEELLPYEMASKIRSDIIEVLRAGETSNNEFSLAMPNGIRWFLGRTSRIPAQGGLEATACSVVRDITDSRRAQDDLRRAMRYRP